ncbi:SPP1 phage holin family protein [Bacillus atrophaeus]|uniref:phage holin n=1 Tax=Bacillus atrophaeus TaxID=1452 RepID=UPI0022817911|nr:phage holin [Bacillus atrophaeus]MCY9198920.1 SPP1 phage holin family protein [Bacillus atrophaeus]
MNTDIVKQITGFLTAVLLFLGTLNVKFDWFTEDSISAFGVVISAGILLAFNLYTIYKNHYGFTKKAKAQGAALKQRNLK